MKKRIILLSFLFSCAIAANAQSAFGYKLPKSISLDILKGSWIAKESKDLKTFKSNHLIFNSIDAACYLKSVWTFETDSTGSISIPASDACEQPSVHPFKYHLLQSQTGFGSAYKINIVFDNGFTDNLYLGDWDGKSKIKMGYTQTNINVIIVYTFKKQ